MRLHLGIKQFLLKSESKPFLFIFFRFVHYSPVIFKWNLSFPVPPFKQFGIVFFVFGEVNGAAEDIEKASVDLLVS
jgi:hypothetical protein